MRNKNSNVKVVKKKLNKCIGICRTYNDVQCSYADILDNDPSIKEIKCNVLLDDFLIEGNYTTDFLCIKINGDMLVRECVYRDKLTKPLNIKLLDLSRVYWLRRGVTDWGIVVNEEK